MIHTLLCKNGKKKRVLILTGAGAVLPWGAPTTKDITDAIFKIGNQTTSGKTSAKFLYDYMAEQYSASCPVNFETIINAVESLFYYQWAISDPNRNELKSDVSLFFKPNTCIEELLQLYPISNGSPTALYNFYKEIISEVMKQVASYINNFKACHAINSQTEEFLNYLQRNKYLLHTYTLNYDRMFIDVCPSINFFDGFDHISEHQTNIPYNNKNGESCKELLAYDISKIDKNINTYYNLHGSIYWEYTSSPRPASFDLHPQSFSFWKDEEMDTLKSTNPGEPILLSKIITGYRKTQRLNTEPFNAFYNSFYQDCLTADIIITIGYSFSDPHINQFLRTGIWNRKTPPLIVNIDYEKKSSNGFENNISPNSRRLLLNLFDGKKFITDCKLTIKDDWIISDDNSLKHYFGGFETFLHNKEWDKILLS